MKHSWNKQIDTYHAKLNPGFRVIMKSGGTSTWWLGQFASSIIAQPCSFLVDRAHLQHHHDEVKRKRSSIQPWIPGSLYYQPKQCIVFREIPQNCHGFVWYGSHLMTPQIHSNTEDVYNFNWSPKLDLSPPTLTPPSAFAVAHHHGLRAHVPVRWSIRNQVVLRLQGRPQGVMQEASWSSTRPKQEGYMKGFIVN